MESQVFGDQQYLKFVLTTKKLLTLTQHRVNDETTIELCLRELNQLNYQLFNIQDDDSVKLLINRLCSNIQAQETSLVTPYALLLSHVLSPTLPLTGRTHLTLKKWLYQILEFSAPSTLPPALTALQKLITFSVPNVNFLELEPLLPKLVASQETQHLTLVLLDSFLQKSTQAQTNLPPDIKRKMKSLVLTVLSTPPRLEDWSVRHSRSTLTALKILTHIVSAGRDTPDLPGDVLGVIQVYLFLGIPEFSLMPPEELHPTVMNLPERVHVPPRGRNPRPLTKSRQSKGRKSSKATEIEVSPNSPNLDIKIGISSDSETSDSERWSQERFHTKIRLQSLQLLQEMMRIMSSKEFFGFWSQIVTKSEKSGESRGLLRLIMKEPMCKIRQSALGILTDAIVHARMFLVHADEAENLSFVTIFGAVGGMLREIHLGLALLLSSERNFAVITQALKCSAALVQITPYGKMREGLAGKLARHCRYFLLHKDPTVRVVALAVFEAFANVENSTPEILDILFRKFGDTNLSKHLQTPTISLSQAPSDQKNQEEMEFSDLDLTSDDFEAPGSRENLISVPNAESSAFLTQICLSNISDRRIHVPVRLQSFKLLGALINCLEGKFQELLDVGVLTKYLVDASDEPDSQVGLHACRVLEIVSSKWSSRDTKGIIFFWNNIFQAVLAVSQREEIVLREVACDCLGTMSNDVITQLSPENLMLVKTTLFGACRDEESAVRAAGLRALGMLINLPVLGEDTSFVEDIVDIVCTSQDDENLGVRVKSAWALANLTDLLTKQEQNDDLEPVSLDLILPKIYRTSICAAQDSNKVRCNALRAVGNVLYLSQGRNLLGDVQLALDVLIASATSGNDMKVRWNACRALGFAISYNPDDIFPQNWKDDVIPALCNLISHSPNFKVRTNAAWALATCKSYGKYVPFLWKSIVLALENSQHVPNFVEYSHRESLVQQLCLTLGHVAVRTDPGDLQILWPDIKDHLEEIEGHMKGFQEKVLPEKTDDFVRARLIMKNYSQTMSLHSNERLIADALGNLFNTRSFYEELESALVVDYS